MWRRRSASINCAAWTDSTRAVASWRAAISQELEGFAGVVLPARGDSGHSWHMFQVLIDFPRRA